MILTNMKTLIILNKQNYSKHPSNKNSNSLQSYSNIGIEVCKQGLSHNQSSPLFKDLQFIIQIRWYKHRSPAQNPPKVCRRAEIVSTQLNWGNITSSKHPILSSIK
jgi:hypothetical protein